MTSDRHQLIELIEQGHVSDENINNARVATSVLPDGKAWLRFIDYLLLFVGGVAIACAALFFIAYNWNDIGRYAKFGGIEVLMTIAVLAFWRLGPDKVSGKVALLMATIFLGVLLALFGQTYQTGADPWQLFFTWALLMLPWAIVGRFAPIWILWLTLLNIAALLYFSTSGRAFSFFFGSQVGSLWTIFIINSVALIVWEYLGRTNAWLDERWAPRLLAVGSGVALSWLVIYSIVGGGRVTGPIVPVWIVWLFVIYHYYRNKKHDLFMLTGLALSVIVVSVAGTARLLLDELLSFGLLLIAVMLIAMSAGAVSWLRSIHKEWES